MVGASESMQKTSANGNDQMFGDAGERPRRGLSGPTLGVEDRRQIVGIGFLYGGDGVDMIIGNDGPETLFGGNDIIHGNGGNDTLLGFSAAMSSMGDGNDLIYGAVPLFRPTSHTP